MTHFAMICPPFQSHVRAFEVLGERLVARGHRTTFLLPAAATGLVRSRHLGLAPIVGDVGLDLPAMLQRAGRPTGPLGILRTVRDSARLTDLLCANGPAIVRAIGAEAVIGDQMEPAAGLLAKEGRLPFVSLACALPIECEPAVPPPFLDWPYDPSVEGLKRNRGAARVTRLFLRRQRRAIEEWALRFGFAGCSTMEDCLSPSATIAQTVRGFDFPRLSATSLHHVGPIRDDPGEPPPLPFAPDPEKPLVYASLGTLQGHRLSVFRSIARAAHSLDVQLVVAHCGGLTDAEAAGLPALHVAADLPQRAVLARADVCITHGGLNTVLDSLEFGVPVLAIPIAFDQPGVAARIEHHGVGVKLSRVLLSERAVRSSLRRLIVEKGFRERAGALGSEIRQAGGAEMAADIVEAIIVAPRRNAASAPERVAEPAE